MIRIQIVHRLKTDKKVKPLRIKLPKMSKCKNSFNKIKFVYILSEKKQLQKKIMKSGIKPVILSKKGILANQYTMENT